MAWTASRHWIAGLALGALVAQPAFGQGLLDKIDNEDIGRVLGGVGGALIGTQIGKGTGTVIAVGAGALGGMLLGGEVGKHLDGRDKKAIADTQYQALQTKEPVAWQNPDSGVQSTARVTETTYRPVPQVRATKNKANEVLWRVPPMQLIGADYQATTTSNIRGGPGTNYAVMGQMRQNERVHVVGKVADKDWYMISRNGVGTGFIYGPLLRRVPGTTTAARPSSTATASGQNIRECSVLEQQVRLPDGTRDVQQARACRTEDGSWELI